MISFSSSTIFRDQRDRRLSRSFFWFFRSAQFCLHPVYLDGYLDGSTASLRRARRSSCRCRCWLLLPLYGYLPRFGLSRDAPTPSSSSSSLPRVDSRATDVLDKTRGERCAACSAESRWLARWKSLDADARDRLAPSSFVLTIVVIVVVIRSRLMTVATAFSVLANPFQFLESSFLCNERVTEESIYRFAFPSFVFCFFFSSTA